MTSAMPLLETDRLLIRPFRVDDLPAIHAILDLDLKFGALPLSERRKWLEWSVQNYEQLANLGQPPYGDRAIVLREVLHDSKSDTGRLIGACGLVPVLAPFGVLPSFKNDSCRSETCNQPEVGLYYAVASEYQRKGYAAEAAQALIDFAFNVLRLRRIVATTERENEASKGVMKRLGMLVEENPFPEPVWFQVVGVLENQS